MASAVTLAVGLVAYGTALNLRPPSDRTYVALNAAAGAVVVAVTAWVTGAAPRELGLSVPSAGSVVAALAVVVAVVGTVPVLVTFGRRSSRVADLLSDGRVRGMSRPVVLRRVLVRIPIGTAGFEEVAFRGALLAMFAEVLTVPAAVIASSVAFGLWHLAPTWQALEANDVRRRAWPMALAVAGTAAAGAVLCVLRLWSGGLLVPWTVHAALNGGALVAAHAHGTGR